MVVSIVLFFLYYVVISGSERFRFHFTYQIHSHLVSGLIALILVIPVAFTVNDIGTWLADKEYIQVEVEELVPLRSPFSKMLFLVHVPYFDEDMNVKVFVHYRVQVGGQKVGKIINAENVHVEEPPGGRGMPILKVSEERIKNPFLRWVLPSLDRKKYDFIVPMEMGVGSYVLSSHAL